MVNLGQGSTELKHVNVSTLFQSSNSAISTKSVWLYYAGTLNMELGNILANDSNTSIYVLWRIIVNSE